MQKMILILCCLLFLSGCKDSEQKTAGSENEEVSLPVSYAKGFTLSKKDDITIVTITNPWPGANRAYSYVLKKEGDHVADPASYDAVITIPVTEIVVTSTTHIPSLEMLEETNALVGFPNLEYISSEATRNRIERGLIHEVGRNEDLNTEVLIDLNPDVVITFAVSGSNTAVNTLQNSGIPVMYNADWTETTPLGKAEWIKFFGVLFGKEREANRIFSKIEQDYLDARELAQKAKESPTVLSGAMYRDVWYLPQGDSWAARFIADANGTYLWKDSEGTGSLSLNLESVLEKGKDAAYWIGPSQFTSLNAIKEAHPVYKEFRAFQQKNVYSFTNRQGATGGVLYYELAPNRPDLVLKDIIHILHPDLLPDHELFFF